MTHKVKNETILVSVILLIAAAFFAGTRLAARKPAAVVEVSVNGTITHEFPLNLEADFTIQTENGGKNHLVIKDGTAEITEASCPDKICVEHAPISESGQTIVCLPNKVVVTIK